MRRFLTPLALAGATALLPVAGLLAAAPAAHASVQDCVSQATQLGVPAELANQACALASGGDVQACTDLLSEFMPAPLAHLACVVATSLNETK
ncbi:hypothetical protein [Kitasatospora sp. NPDC004531]